MAACGLDFGTSNTTLGLPDGHGAVLAALEDGRDTVPSAVFYDRAGHPRIGRAAVRAYVEGEDGRLMRALKSVLGTALLDETTAVGRRRIPFRAVIGEFIATVKARAEADRGVRLDKVVMGRPVFFVDDDAAGNAKAQDALEEVAHSIGFSEVSFQYEPIAAALDYEQQVTHEELALIADIGGGTSDFSIVRLAPERRTKPDRVDDILANDGVRIGGTDFDRQLSLSIVMPLLGYRSPMKQPGRDVPSAYYFDLATWSAINRLYTPKTVREIVEVKRDAAHPALLDRLLKVIEDQRGHTLAIATEGAKIALAEEGEARLDLKEVESGLIAELDRGGLETHTATLAERVARRVGVCLEQAGLTADQIDAVFLTGGSTRLAHVRSAILAAVPNARVVDGDTFGSVGTGLALEARRRFG
ncbi:molecular chaperone [Azorhizobium caulinodans ORS 571]|uniref:Molecular chaperone n=1 Tax=Azorhizobium caulinodans (strain ATCC 43989 / DSM 5975 / JCM 20966 / LMG 6465 / NBRC 14845 / NCIMB 13405 / ORS 571) TaxID=438753 RepID=A8HW53_AZOC5|nr:Hsp70 family protein [Azorhizobium caulinodans]BAF90391.1 molecular chaperone [Azorhizobium caulinodans ORS 571]